jgi:hypothetical protein
MRAVFESHPVDFHEPEVSLMDQRSGLQRVPRPLTRHAPVSEPVKLFIDDGNEDVERCRITISPVSEQFCNVNFRPHAGNWRRKYNARRAKNNGVE